INNWRTVMAASPGTPPCRRAGPHGPDCHHGTPPLAPPTTNWPCAKCKPSELLISSFLRDYQPMFLPMLGACVPFDPQLADSLVQLYPEYQERIAVLSPKSNTGLRAVGVSQCGRERVGRSYAVWCRAPARMSCVCSQSRRGGRQRL